MKELRDYITEGITPVSKTKLKEVIERLRYLGMLTEDRDYDNLDGNDARRLIDEQGNVRPPTSIVGNKDITEFGLNFSSNMISFDCSGCKKLTSLKGSPQELCGNFNCSGCTSLKNLVGGPKILTGTSRTSQYLCQDCTGLTSLKGVADTIDMRLDMSGCTGIKNMKYFCKVKKPRYINATGCTSLVSIKDMNYGDGVYPNGFCFNYCTRLKSIEGLSTHMNRGAIYLKGCQSLTAETLIPFLPVNGLHELYLEKCPKVDLLKFIDIEKASYDIYVTKEQRMYVNDEAEKRKKKSPMRGNLDNGIGFIGE